jgi:hypothetical protein
MWLFSYLANGMNIKDVALLRYENITGNERKRPTNTILAKSSR